jgi:hypothetical protein
MEYYVPAVRAVLVELAKAGETMTYEALQAKLGGPGRGYIGQVLSDICIEEQSAGRPLLTSIIVRKQSGDPGPGYWALPMTKSTPIDQRASALKAEQLRVSAYWRDH